MADQSAGRRAVTFVKQPGVGLGLASIAAELCGLLIVTLASPHTAEGLAVPCFLLGMALGFAAIIVTVITASLGRDARAKPWKAGILLGLLGLVLPPILLIVGMFLSVRSARTWG